MCNPLISVIVPVYRVEAYLERCIQSVLYQTYTHFELLLIDDGSPDNCGKLCDQAAREDSRIHVIHQNNAGLSEARNSGLKICKGEFITFLDSDDFWHRDYLKIMFEKSQEYDADIVQCTYEVGNGNGFVQSYDWKPIVCNSYEALANFNYKVSAWAKLYRKSIISGVFFPKGLKNEDDATYYRFAYNAKRIIIIPNCLYYYYQSPLSIMRGKSDFLKEDFIKIYDERIEFFKSLNEPLFVCQSHVRFALVLMLFYMACKSNPKNMNDHYKLLKKFRSEYYYAKKNTIPIKLSVMFYIFNISPDLSSCFVNKLGLR